MSGEVHGWKPITLRAPILGGLIFISALLIVVLEVLFYISTRNSNMNGGGVAFGATVDSLSSRTTFLLASPLYQLDWASEIDSF